ncbi:hypothetical protein TIFTF001_037882 [Ficus carica]|uniref:Uncharacterized protein n=1 Tax=Ficus carica TaxID=3494 RepID=A0AA88E6T1_FICCA|nr:hypothetical protein TIFTF001_037862 [Ficus carica]GMN68816.1 hypothetical protein TIFTF001_037867 [Ficus carica]GMN68826.1 hypothetical protein TIFTF001_037877 [Ficus carica]GMN68831.1 hypothetical protein TIFTF001_037882 [Ficus carica]
MEVKVTVEVGSCKYNEVAGMEMVEVGIHSYICGGEGDGGGGDRYTYGGGGERDGGGGDGDGCCVISHKYKRSPSFDSIG